MAPRSSSGSGWPDSTSNLCLNTPVGDGGRGSERGSRSRQSKTPSVEKHVPPPIALPAPGQEGDQITPAETTGSSPPLSSPCPTAKEMVEVIKSQSFEPNVAPMGFTNSEAPKYPTNVCYRNAVITMLLNIPTFSKLLTVYGSRQEVKIAAEGATTLEQSAPMFQSLVALNKRYWAGSSRNKQAELNKAMDAFFREFLEIDTWSTNQGRNQWNQEDAEDFLSTLLARVEEELKVHDPEFNDALQTLLRFGLLPRKHCLNGCRPKKLRGSVINHEKVQRCHLGRNLPQGQTHQTFEEALRASMKSQLPMSCPSCKRTTSHRISEIFVELPKLLFTTLNRDDKNSDKIQTDCALPPSFVPVVDKDCEQQACKYRIIGIVAHQGAKITSGHNISYVPNHDEPGAWYMIDSMKVTDKKFKDITKYVKAKKNVQQLPYVIAWELMDESEEQIGREVGGDNYQQSPKQELDSKGKALDVREQMLKKKEKASEEREKRLKSISLQESELQKKEAALEEKEKVLNQKDRVLNKRLRAVVERERQLGDRETALNQREMMVENHEKDVQTRAENDNRHHNPSKDNGTPPQQFAANAKGQIEQEVEQREDTATFCATFRNANNHDENARAIFKLNNFNPDAPTKIESTVQLSDLQGNLRSIKRGTTVADELTITFNAKGAKKRKRDGDDDDGEADPPPSPSKKAKGPAGPASEPRTLPAEEPQKSLKGEHEIKGPRNIKNESQDKKFPVKREPPASAGIKKEPSSPRGTLLSPRRSPANNTPPPPPPPRRSTRANRGKRSKVA